MMTMRRNFGADGQSAVSRIGNPPADRTFWSLADCQSAKQQAASLRYDGQNRRPHQ
jgi:hypothetical protein